jgi:chemotaxis family two-component system response regulator Rcp1
MDNDQFKIADILLVEDNLGDIRLTEEALKESRLTVNLNTVMDGEEAMSFLRKQGKYATAPTPDLILLDLNLPKKDGRQVLKEIKEDANLKTIPIVILTISNADQDIIESYDLNANCYITKPLDFNKFIEVVKSIEDFWLAIVRLPPKKPYEK